MQNEWFLGVEKLTSETSVRRMNDPSSRKEKAARREKERM